MNKIESVIIDEFWGDKTVKLKLHDDVNFLIGVNGSGKTTIINLIAATLKADFSTLDRFEFKKIHINLKAQIVGEAKKTAYIEVEKTEKNNSPYPNIFFKIKKYDDREAKAFRLDELEEEHLFRQYSDYVVSRKIGRNKLFEKDINIALQGLINVSWLSIHRVSSLLKRREERSFESTIDQKIEELQIDLVKYFSQLNTRYTAETEKFQKYIFESLIEVFIEEKNAFSSIKIDAENEKALLRQIFLYFNLDEDMMDIKLNEFFDKYEGALSRLTEGKKGVSITDFFYLQAINKIHSVVQEWNNVTNKQKSINKSKDTFLRVINSLLQRKELIINDKNELTVKANSEKTFPLISLSSGEKQLLIILGQSLLQEENIHIYIADEPELSLHIEWQEKLVKSLKSINPNSQIIFATHSPDIVGEYDNAVIQIEEAII